MKKYIPYILLALIIFLAGRWTKEDNSGEVERQFKANQKVILDALFKKQLEVTQLTKDGEKKDERIAALETAVESGDKKIAALEARSHRRVEAVAKYTPSQRDSLFYAKYPGQDTIRNVDSRKVAIDLVHLEGLDSLNTALHEQVDTLKAAFAEQKERTNIERQKFEKQKEITADFVRWGESWRNQSDYYRKRERKARVKNKFLGGAVLVLSIIIIAK